MDAKDLLITPLVLLFVLLIAYLIRDLVSDKVTRRYFILALLIKIVGALSLGIIYQFYYEGGDTFAFHTHGSKIIWECFMESPFKGLSLLFQNGIHQPETWEYSSRIWYFNDQQSFFVIRLAAIIDIFTYGTYSSTAIFFAIVSFSGLWVFYLVLYSYYPKLHFQFAIVVFLVPSLIFWGSGILKDTLMIGCLGWAVFSAHSIFIKSELKWYNILVFMVSCWVIFSVKKYVLLTFLPAGIIWIYLSHIKRIKSALVKYSIAPILILTTIIASYYSIIVVGQNDPRYAMEKLALTAKITAYDIRYWTGRDAGSGYSLGELDGTFQNMLSLAPEAINVTLFRPYLWEVANPLMLLASIESLALLFFTIFAIYKLVWHKKFQILRTPLLLFLLIFSIVFAFAVGISTYNFGTLVRYKIPLIPFYLASMVIISYTKNETLKYETN